MNPLADSPAARKIVYTLFWFASLVVGALGVGYGAASAGIPSWYAPVAAVYAFLAAAVGYTASSNVPANPADTAEGADA
jgi:hypothetical protein